MKKLLIAVLALGLAGCSTTPVSSSLAKEVKASSSYQFKQGYTPVTIIRDKGFVAGGCAITAFINGNKVADLETGEKVIAYVEPGEVIVGAGFVGTGLCNGAPRKEREFTVKERQPRTLRIFIDQSANVDILPTTEH
ncbi:hypothetical protein [Rahnella contaminans]|uniref:hypothetical protein n=1 Tax=Rahnella contaminans TaxID=2703882 RepID=UPI0023DC8EF5|nr:hypothetical protein [Rahnella contaminans]MDF1895073.1 hypothetical protein [Rahnella contaminans]